MRVVLGLTLCVVIVFTAPYDGKKKSEYYPVNRGGVGGQFFSGRSVGAGQVYGSHLYNPTASGLYMYCYPINGHGARGTFGIGAAYYGPDGGYRGLHEGYGGNKHYGSNKNYESNKHYGNNKKYKSNKKSGYASGGFGGVG